MNLDQIDNNIKDGNIFNLSEKELMDCVSTLITVVPNNIYDVRHQGKLTAILSILQEKRLELEREKTKKLNCFIIFLTLLNIVVAFLQYLK